MPRRRPQLPPPGAFPRFANLGDVLRLFSGDRATHGLPPGTHWTWLAFPESWPLVTLDQGNYTGPLTAVGSPGDLWWFTLAEMSEHAPGAIPAWLAQLLAREVSEFTGPLAAAFVALGSVPLIWTVPTYGAPMVAAYQPHYRLAFGGPLFTDEEWSCRLNITSAGTLPDSTAADGMLAGLVSAVTAWVTSADSRLSTATGLSWVKFNEMNALGHYTNPDNTRLAEPVGVLGTGTPVMPPQVAVVVSLLTAHARGKAHAGRMFTPALACGVGEGFLSPSASQTTGMVSNATALLNAINAVVDPAGVSIISATGESNHVTKVALGRIFDTMRSRRRSLSEKPYVIGSALA